MDVLALLLQAPVADAALRYSNPLKDPRTGRALSCPDPHVIDLRKRGFRYVMVCTTDYEPNALAIRTSRDLVHWYSGGSVFPRGHQPWWAVNSGRSRGRFWAPEIYRIRGKWIVYFSAQLDRSKVRIPLT